MHLLQYHNTICHILLMSQWWTHKPREPTASCTHNNAQHTTKNRKHRHHVSPMPPASSGSHFTGEWDHRMSHNRCWSPQYGDVTLINKTNCSVILFTIILQTATWRACGQKVSFYKLLLVLFLRNCIRTTRTNISYPVIFYLPTPTSTSHVSAWFWMRGGGRYCHNVFRKKGRLQLLLA
jgi:hypothetical protein